uniref:ycf20-like protein n=1 Tax=Erigeron canadensis TaxID=72917 RepID=UPI001CB9A242|nr:ycf20-like protein [Erigeron canadensis]
MVPATLMPSSGYLDKLCTTGYLQSNVSSVHFSSDLLRNSPSYRKTLYTRFWIFHLTQPLFIKDLKKMTWHIRSNAEGSASSTNNNSNGTRLIRTIRAFQVRINARIKDLRKDLPMKLLFFLTGFYCSTAFATVIGQTGDWDILSAALAVVVVEGIGALMYTGSLPLFGKVRNVITMFNYWKAGLCMGLFLDSFKY